MDNNNLIVIRADHKKNYKIINLTCVNDQRLSWKAKGIFNYLITRPPFWEIHTSDLIERSNDGKSSLYSGIKELIETGYIFRITKRVNGKIVKWGYLTTEIPCSNEDIVPLIPKEYSLYSKNLNIENLNIKNKHYNNKEENNNKESFNIKSSKEDLTTPDGVDQPDFINSDSNDNIDHYHKQTLKHKMSSPLLDNQDKVAQKHKKTFNDNIDKCCADVQNLYEFWNNLGKPLKQHKQGSKSNHEAIIALKKAIKQFDADLIMNAMELYHKIINCGQEYQLNIKAPGHLVGLNEFFRFSDFTLTRINKNNCAYGIQSWFEECSKGELYMNRVYGKHKVEDEYPDITKKLKQYWKKFTGENAPSSPSDEECFRLAAIKFKQFMKKYRKNYRLNDNIDMDNLAVESKCLYESLENDVDDWKKVRPSWLCSENMFKKRLLFWLLDQGMMDPEDDEDYDSFHNKSIIDELMG